MVKGGYKFPKRKLNGMMTEAQVVKEVHNWIDVRPKQARYIAETVFENYYANEADTILDLKVFIGCIVQEYKDSQKEKGMNV